MADHELGPDPLPESHEIFPLVLIVEDCRPVFEYRPDGDLTGQTGFLLGDYIQPPEPDNEYEDDDLGHDVLAKLFKTENPITPDPKSQIKTFSLFGVIGQSGKLNFISGLQCWYATVDKSISTMTPEIWESLQRELAITKQLPFRGLN